MYSFECNAETKIIGGKEKVLWKFDAFVQLDENV